MGLMGFPTGYLDCLTQDGGSENPPPEDIGFEKGLRGRRDAISLVGRSFT